MTLGTAATWEIAIEEFETAPRPTYARRTLRRRRRRRQRASSTSTSSGSPVAHATTRPRSRPRPTCSGRRPSRRAASCDASRSSCRSTGWTRCGAGTTASTPSRSPPATRDAALDQFLLAVRPPGRVGRAARLGDPLRGALQLRQAADPRLGLPQLRARARRAVHATTSSARSTTRLARWTRVLARLPTRARARRCPTTSTATTAAGTTRPRSTTTG